MQAYNELVPPTAVTHAIAIPFLSADSTNLIVAKTSLLQLFSITPSDKLRLIGEYPLAGTVTALARVKVLSATRNGGEALLLAFRDAKLSLVEWDRENHRLSTISIHYYEGENVVAPPFEQGLGEYENVLTVDPGSRCAALKFGARQLAILPFRQFGDELIGEEEGDFEGKTEKMEEDGDDRTHTPYKASFVLPLTTLDPSLCHIVNLAFLYEYREATFGILSSAIEPSAALFDERKDCLTYTVFTLDLEQKASTNLITVSKLPSSLWKVVPLPLPTGGALLVGTNEFVHIDQSGKANATAVNEFAKVESEFGMVDQSVLNLKLEGCCIEVLDSKTGELLVVLNDGSLATINFRMLGRSVSSVDVTIVSADNGGAVFPAAASCLTRLDNSKIFVGSEDGPSSLLGWSRLVPSLARKRSHAQMLGKDLEDDDDEDVIDEDDDDLYVAAPEAKKRAASAADPTSTDSFARFEVSDTLRSIGPINNICLGKRPNSAKDKLQLLAGTGRGRSSRLTCLNRDILPLTVRKSQFDGAKNVWAIHTKQPNVEDDHDDLLFVYDGSDTKVYDITPASADESGEGGYIGRSASEFEHEGETLYIGTLADGASIVQIRKTEIRTYDATNIGLNQIIPMMDDDTDAEFVIIHTSFCDPYLLVIRDDSSVLVLQVQGKEIEPLENEGLVAEKKWMSGCVYSGSLTANVPALFLLSADGVVNVFSLPELELIYSLPGLIHLPPVISAEGKERRAGVKETLTELLISDLGTTGITSPYLIIRTALDDIILYEPFTYHSVQPAESEWYEGLRFRKVPVPYIPKYNDTALAAGQAEESNARQPALKRIQIGEYIAVALPGSPPSLLLREGASPPKILGVAVAGDSSSLAPLNRVDYQHGFATLSRSGGLMEHTLPKDAWFGTGWNVKQIELAVDGNTEEVRQLAYHKEKSLWIVGTCRKVDFYFAKEDGRHNEQDDINLRPQVPQYSIHLLSATTHQILYSYPLPTLETLTDLKVLSLESSEITHIHKPLVVASTASQRGEDMPARGAVVVFDIIDVVPDPDVPESNHKLHVLAREESRGAITALTQFPGGLVGTAQGLKLMIRGMREDGSCLPVAFLDAQCHTTVLKTLSTSGLWIAGDIWKGLWFGGFTEEPYKLTVLGKSAVTAGVEVISAEFLPFDGGLFLLVWDAEEDLHVLQYDPENPVTSGGLRLLHRSTFHVGHFPTGSLLVPSTLAPFAEQARELPEHDGDETKQAQVNSPLYHVLTTSLTGAIGLVTPLDESTYRRLSALQGHLTNVLEHPAGLNPRAYRTGAGVEGAEVLGAKGVVDGGIVQRIAELGVARRAEVLGRAGGDGWGLRSDLEVLSGGGLGFL